MVLRGFVDLGVPAQDFWVGHGPNLPLRGTGNLAVVISDFR